MFRKKIAFWSAFVMMLTICLIGTAQAVGEFGSQERGVDEGTGTSFSINDSTYLNVGLEASHEIQAILESSAGTVDLYIIPTNETVVSLTLSGFEPLGTYYKYVNTFDSGIEVTADDTGSLTFVQQLGDGVHIFFKETPSTIYIGDSGWSDSAIGTWDPATRIATLTTDLNEAIEVTSNDITLDGSGHTVVGMINLTGRQNVTVKNFILRGDEGVHGIECHQASRNHIVNNDISVGRGVHLWQGGGNVIEGNTFTNCFTGVFVSIYSWGNEIINNTFTGCEYGMQYLAYSGANVTGNLFNSNGKGIYLYGSDNNSFTENDFINNGIGLSFECNESGSGQKPDYNKIYNNNFLDNDTQAYICGENNSINMELPDGGNHWSDWTAPDDNSNGIVDLPYEIRDSYNQYTNYDNLPWVIPTGWQTNQAPIFDQLGPQEVTEYTALTFTVSASDPDGDNVVSLVAGSLPEGAIFDEITGQFTWMPLGDQAGVYIVNFSATDDGEPATTSHMDVVITVGEVESPTDLTDTLTDIIIVNDEMLEAVENSYMANLKKINDFIEAGQINAAINQLEAFIHKTQQDVKHGVISAVDGDLYIMIAQDIIDLLTGA